ncbi:unnamed protein product [Oikopleura dioica]|uniref:Transmembrane protein 26 n=1 Tax=Oikopleura dioica TaxID=34765 RepID=E4YPY1_OIKDI|nr:unnamed protein product [Oikopleura dioica]
MTFLRSSLDYYRRNKKIINALSARILYLSYIVFTVYQTYLILPFQSRNDRNTIFLLFTGLLGFVFEFWHAIFIRKGNEIRWLVTMNLAMLSAAVPCIWLMEGELLEKRVLKQEYSPPGVMVQIGGVSFEAPDMVLFLEQVLIFALVIGRWLAPKNDEQDGDYFSAILVGNLAVGADILELLESLGDESLGVNEVAVYSILALWSLSLIIFGFEVPNDVLMREDSSRKYVEIDALPRARVLNKFLTGEVMSPEMLQITSGLFFLDVPYLILRIVLMVEHGFYTSSGLFFAMKNTLMLLLQSYRLFKLQKSLPKFRHQRRLLSTIPIESVESPMNLVSNSIYLLVRITKKLSRRHRLLPKKEANQGIK